ncbi:hypothetical protein [Paenibacillus sp. DCT19]|uniref:hypothetical protein n=1 Tax=Paenibacillus sp. DCT19 TaxID=2211212 RepID=UPI000FE1FBCB|nr:hypothetical protein [Paenibacillus sp. DCT19]
MNEILKVDKQYTSHLVRAIDAVRASELAKHWNVDITCYHIQLSLEDDTRQYGKPYYSVWFYPHEITPDNWMDGSWEEIDLCVHLDCECGEVLSIHGGRN